LAILAALTPTAVNLLGSINPQSIEIAGTILLWISLLALFTEPDSRFTTRRIVRVILAALLISNSRGMGPLFTTLIVVIVLLAVPWPRVKAVFADRRLWWAVIGGVAVTGFGTAWIFFGGSLPAGAGSGIGWGEALRVTFDAIGWYLFMQIGVFGWLDVAPPQWFYGLGFALLGFLAVLGFAAGRRRERRVLLLVAALMIFMPMLIETWQARIIGYFWQGRYIFPISMGLILLAGWVIDRYTSKNLGVDVGSLGPIPDSKDAYQAVPQWLQDHLVVLLASAFAFLNIVGFTWNLHRYVNGINGSWLQMTTYSWVPPLPPVALVLMYALAWVIFIFTVVRSTAGCFESIHSHNETLTVIEPDSQL
jgi:hypothetical protein